MWTSDFHRIPNMKALQSKKIWLYILFVAIVAILWKSDVHKLNEKGKSEEKIAAEAKQSVTVEEKAKTLASSELTETYRSDLYGFSLSYPEGLKTSFFQDGNTAIMAISDGATGLGVQIAVTPFDEPNTTITAERVKKDIPDIVFKEPQEVTLGSMGKGIAWIDGAGADAKRQVWFAARGHLFQLTAPMRFDAPLKKMLNTWVFH